MYIDHNIKLLETGELHWIGALEGEGGNIEFISNDGDIESFLIESKQIVILNGTIDEEMIPNPNKIELYFVIGVNGLKEIENLLEVVHKESFIIVIEPEKEFFTHVLHNKKMELFKDKRVILYTDYLENIHLFISNLFRNFNILSILKNVNFYITEYYRTFAIKEALEIVKAIKASVRDKMITIGNSVEDSLIGFSNNLINFKKMDDSYRFASIKGRGKGYPAIVVSAGPSLEKNIKLLKGQENSFIIIAVDTILRRLLNEKIVPDFVCSVERGKILYDYFYKDVEVPSNVYFVGPTVVDSEIIEKFKGRAILPIRSDVAEYEWFKKIYQIEDHNNEMMMGASCAHVAFGLAQHLAAEPIILIGQDLAYSLNSEQTHAEGTYINVEATGDAEQEIVDDEFIADFEVEGYYQGTTVKTTYIWNSFRLWFEREIESNQLNVINATEGGAKIHHTKNMPLKEVIEVYQRSETDKKIIDLDEQDKFHFNFEVIYGNFKGQLKEIERINKEADKQLQLLNKTKVLKVMSQQQFLKILKAFVGAEGVINKVINNRLLAHILQPIIMNMIWDVKELGERMTFDTLTEKKRIYIKAIATVIVVLVEIKTILEQHFEERICNK